ncbi:hypothetical protein [Chelativorans salis]|uniref:Uncharacterized protein n=1 Tax=Chelativorans salis TaxID=2978478 RepID=A0ABT2LQM2_9HYPH|nr:hypothetical protein [Chelativorans sp. EGI FJ00035]MCT7376636.1 hypothetical protein [Chelativorans sp. EGI FJ00035]
MAASNAACFRDFHGTFVGKHDDVDLENAMAATASALDLPMFAYLSLPTKPASDRD